MSASHPPSKNPDELDARIDRLCDRFERAWQQRDPEPIESVLSVVDSEAQRRLLRELLEIELEYRLQEGHSPSEEQYKRRFPDHGDIIESVLRSVIEETDHHDGGQTSCVGRPEPDQPHGMAGQSLTASHTWTHLKYLARGGLGEVYIGMDQRLNRSVAIKFMHAAIRHDAEARRRFLVEAEVTSRLDHPGVVPVYARGETSSGQPYYVMRLIQGESLQDLISQYHDAKVQRTSTEQRRQLVRLVGHLAAAANTVAYAHNRGVLHRDLKPANIMVGRYGETLVVDWGLAEFFLRDERGKASGEETLLPAAVSNEQDASNHGAGTLGYMSPEQTDGRAGPLGPPSDVYSLGATLYKVLTGKVPFDRRDSPDILDRIRCGDFPAPRDVAPECPTVLEAICLKAMALRPDHRYVGAWEMAEDLRRFIADEPVSIYREPMSERVVRWGRRHRAWALATVLSLVLLLVVTVSGLALLQHRAAIERGLREDAQVAENHAELARQRNLRTSALFAANSLGYEIDQRWRILSECAADPALHALVRQGEPENRDLMLWLARKSSRSLELERATSWFINDARGVQLARNPIKDTIGLSFAHRSYFHGLGRDLDDTAVAEVDPIDRPTLSAVYFSSLTGESKVAFTVPIWDNAQEQGDPIGVIGMSVELGQLVRMEAELRPLSLILVDLRGDWLEGTKQRGLILDHPLMRQRRGQSMGQETSVPRIADDQLQTLVRIHDARLLERLRPETVEPTDTIQPQWRDPLRPPTEAFCVAALEPVLVPGREAGDTDTMSAGARSPKTAEVLDANHLDQRRLEDTGWMLILEDRTKIDTAAHETVAAPAAPTP